MSFANSSYSDIIATTIQNRSGKIADNVTDNNALLKVLSKRGNVKPFSGGNVILQEISFAENGNVGYYSGYDLLPVAAQDVISAAEFSIKQAAVPVVVSGLEELQNAGKEQIIDLLEGRISVAEASLANLLANGIYSDGTGSGGKQITGLDAAVPVTPTNTYGGIDRGTWTFWKNQVDNDGSAVSSTTVQGVFNALYAACLRGSDHPDLIVLDNATWATYMASLQANQRFTDADTADLGFPTVKFMGSNVVLDGGIGGNATANTAYFLNTKYIFWRPHSKRNMVPLSPNKRYAVNQDAEVQIIAFAGNLTCSGAQYQGRWDGN
jgi:hypothetical protein